MSVRPDDAGPDGGGDRARVRSIAEPFAPPGVDWTAVSPRLITVRRLGVLLGLAPFLVPIAVLTVVLRTGWPLLALVPLLLVLAWLLWLVPRQVRAIGYAEREDDLLVRKGLMFRQAVVVPYGRMQYVDVNAGPVDRRFGISSVQLHTASPGTDASIPGLPPEEAARLRDRLAARGEARLAGL